MNRDEIAKFLDSFSSKRSRTIVIVDFANMDKWRESLGWKIGIQELSRLIKHLSIGKVSLRRFYYGSDYGPDEKSLTRSIWSQGILTRAESNGFQIVDKRVKYIHSAQNPRGYEKKCDLDVEMSVDLIKMRDEYDDIVLFSGDGDLAYAFKYLKETYSKNSYVFGARNHVGKEVMDALRDRVVEKIFYIEDFEYRLNMDRFRYQ